MKLLMIYCEEFGFTPTFKTLPDVPDAKPAHITGAVVGFIHVEPGDLERSGKVTTKLVKHLKWLAGKNETRRIVLHSFAHLGEAKAEPAAGREVLQLAQKRLETAGYEVWQTPYGHFNDLVIRAPGHPLARVYQEF